MVRNDEMEREPTTGVPGNIKKYAQICGSTCALLALADCYSVIRGLFAIGMLSGYGLFGYGIVLLLIRAASAALLLGDAHLMYRMHGRWQRDEAERYFAGIVIMGAGLAIAGLVGGLFVPSWLSYLPEWIWGNVLVGAGCAVGYFLVCRREGIALAVRFSPEMVRETVMWMTWK